MRRTAPSAQRLAFSPIFAAPGYQDWDTALEKNWTFRETMRAQFRFETFNTFNHPQFYAPASITPDAIPMQVRDAPAPLGKSPVPSRGE